jgi:hypothetical protein
MWLLVNSPLFLRLKIERIELKSQKKRTSRDKFKCKWSCLEVLSGIPSLKLFLRNVAVSDNGLLKVNCLFDVVDRVKQSLKAHYSRCLPTDKSISSKIQIMYTESLESYASEGADNLGRVLVADRCYQSENGLDSADFLDNNEDTYKRPILGDCCKVPYGAVIDTSGCVPSWCGNPVKHQCNERRRSCIGMYFCDLCFEHTTHGIRLFCEDFQNEEEECWARWHAAKMDGLIKEDLTDC